MSFDDVLEDIGGVGYFQILLLLSFCFLKFSVVSGMNIIVFLYFERKYTCYSESGRLINETSQMCPDKCKTLEFDKSIRKTTVISQYKLICSKEIMTPISISLFFVGFLIGGICYGVLSDNFGRIKMLTIAGLHTMVTNFITPFMPNVWLYTVMRVLNGMGVAALLALNNSTFAEYVPAGNRFTIYLTFQIMFAIGGVIFSGVAYVVLNHQYLQLTINIFTLPVLTYYFLVPESPRWLISRGRFDEAYKMTLIIAKWNKKTISREKFDEILSLPDSTTQEDKLNVANPENNKSKLEEKILLSDKRFLIVSLVLWFSFFSLCLCDLLIVLNAPKLGGSTYINMVLLFITELLGCIATIVVGKFINRKPLFLVGLLISAALSILQAAFYQKKDYDTLNIGTAVTSKFFIGNLINFMYVYCFEAFPTKIRSSLTGGLAVSGSIGSILMPFVSDLDKLWIPTPFVISGILLFLSAMFSIFLPETKNKGTPENNADGIRLINSNPIWAWFEKFDKHKIETVCES